MLAHIDRMWMLPPFRKALAKREREKVLMEHLHECLQQLFRNPTTSGLNLETLNAAGGHPVLSARITKAFRLILVELGQREVGLLYFDNHDEAYKWVDHHRSALPTMLTKMGEIVRNVPLQTAFEPIPAVLADENSPFAIASAEQFRRMVAEGIARYLTYLDEDQRRLADLNVTGLLLIKGGAGTGKTAVAIHRILNLARQPALPGVGPAKVLYLCYNNVLARVVHDLLIALSNGVVPPEIEVKTFHAWCGDFLTRMNEPYPSIDADKWKQLVYEMFGKLSPDKRSTLGGLNGTFVADEIEHVIKHNGLSSQEEYRNFNRRGRRITLKQAGRDAVWEVYDRSRLCQQERNIWHWSDLPLLALDTLGRNPRAAEYRAVVIDEAQDCTPVMVRLARKLVTEAGGSLAVFADPAQAIYDCGFQWTQRELRPSGGNVRWLKKSYRTTQQIFDLAYPLLENSDDLQEERDQLERPARHGKRPRLVVAQDEDELRLELVGRIGAEASSRPLNQIAVLAATRQELELLAAVLQRKGLATELIHANNAAFRLENAAVKLLTMMSAKGLDFPVIFLVAPRKRDLGGESHADLPETRRTLYVSLTRASEDITIGAVDGRHHPLLDQLGSQYYDVEGSRAREWQMMH